MGIRDMGIYSGIRNIASILGGGTHPIPDYLTILNEHA